MIRLLEKLLRRDFIVIACSGLFLGFSVVVPALTAPPIGNSAVLAVFFSILEWIAIVPAACVILFRYSGNTKKSSRYRGAYARGFLFFMCYYLVMFHWFIYLYPLEFAGMTPAAAVVVVAAAWFGLSALQACVFAFVFLLIALAARLISSRGKPATGDRTAKTGGGAYILPFLAGAMWVVFEWLQTQTWAGVPWGRLAIGQYANGPVIQSISLFGSYFVTFLIVTVNFTLASALINKRFLQPPTMICGALFSLNLLFGIITLSAYADSGNPLCAAALQCNIASADKWDDDVSLDKTIEICKRLSLAAAAGGAELIVLPETAIPYTLLHYPSLTARVAEIAQSTGADILVGAFTSDVQGEAGAKVGRGGDGSTYNSVIHINPEGEAGEVVYSKRHLVPFGEFLPMRGLISVIIPPLAELNIMEGDITPGTESAIFSLPGANTGSFICFDSIYEELARKSVLDGAELLVIMTNDSWFLDSAAAYMHNAQAVLRAVEFNRYVVRSANTGISSVITPTGQIAAFLEPLVEGYVYADVYARDNLTLYTAIGNTPVALCCVFSAAAFGWFVLYKNKREKRRLD